MANPLVVNCAADAWTKVATNVTTGMIWTIGGGPGRYYFTQRDTGDPAPTDLTDAIGFDTMDDEGSNPGMPIQNSTGIDVYIWPTSEAGRVRVDL